MTFSTRGKELGDSKQRITLSYGEFICRLLMHVLSSGFQKIRYYGFLNNQMKFGNLKTIFQIHEGRRFRQHYMGLSMSELLKAVWGISMSVWNTAVPPCSSWRETILPSHKTRLFPY